MNLKTPICLGASVALLLAGSGRALAQDSNSNASSASTSDARPTARSFEIIEQNNIFNPNRRPPTTRSNGPPPPRSYYFTLNGTMTYENREYAFFNGTGANRDHFAKSDTINGYKIVEITNNTVKLEGASNQIIKLQPGMQMHRVENGPWTLVASSMSSPASDSSTPGADSNSDNNSAGDSGALSLPLQGAQADIVKKLMARRALDEGTATNNSTTSNGDQNQ
jgi:hypothetical protein